MPKVKWGIDTDEPEELEVFDVYDGPDPVRGVYNGVIKRLQIKENRNGDDMLNGLWVAHTDDKHNEKYKYNGWGVWFTQNITDQGKPYTLQFLKSIGLNWKDFIGGTVTDTAERPTNVTKIGRVKFNDGNEPACKVSIKMGKASSDGQYAAKLEIGQFLPPHDADGLAEFGEPADDGDENPFA